MIPPDRRSVFRESEPRDGRRLRRRSLRSRTGFALLDVAKPGTGPGRFDADRHQRAGFFRRRRRGRQRFLESRGVLDDVIGRQHEHRRGMIARRDPTRAESDGRRGIAFRRFGHDIFLRQIRQQLTHGRFLFDVRQNQNAFRRDQAIQPRDRLLRAASSWQPDATVVSGRARRLNGQKRSPLPPARMSA